MSIYADIYRRDVTVPNLEFIAFTYGTDEERQKQRVEKTTPLV